LDYYVIKNETTGEYYRGKGANQWGKYYNQASIFRYKNMALDSAEELVRRGLQVKIITIRILELAE
jgi:hypothetical protein